MIIKKVKIKKLWGIYDLEWDLDSSVNVLSGINGSGKTTVLDAIAGLCVVGEYPKDISCKFKSVEIIFSNNYSLHFVRFKDSFTNLEKQAKDINHSFELKAIIDDIKKKLNEDISKINRMEIEAGISYAKKNDKNCKVDEVLKNINTNIVSTFDQQLRKDDDAIKITELKNNEIKTELDWEIYRLQEEYLNYQVNIGKEIECLLSKDNNDIKKEILNIYKKIDLFKRIINDSFKSTNKKIDDEKNRISFICNDNYKITPYQLSSGEKQLLIILLKTLLQNEKECILFMDEPEISLHIDWQNNLLKNIKQLNEKCQIIIASHSPAMIMNGWLDKVFNISDLYTFNASKNGKLSR